MCGCTNVNLCEEDHFRIALSKTNASYIYYLLGDDYALSIKCSLCFSLYPSEIEDIRFLSVYPFLSVSLSFSRFLSFYLPFFPPRTERDCVAHEPMRRRRSKQVFPRGMRDRILTPRRRHAATGQFSPLRGLPVMIPGLPSARASATPRAHRQ